MLIVERRGDGRLVTKHEMPTCAEYDQSVADAGSRVRFEGYEVDPQRR
jgi:hypothetical protein